MVTYYQVRRLSNSYQCGYGQPAKRFNGACYFDECRFEAREVRVLHKEGGKSEQGKVKQGQAKQGKAKQGKAKQGKPKQGKAKQGKAKQGKAKQGKAKQGKPNSNGRSTSSSQTFQPTKRTKNSYKRGRKGHNK